VPIRFPHGRDPYRIIKSLSSGDMKWRALFVAQVAMMFIGAAVLIALLSK